VSGEKAHRANVVSAEELHRRAVTAARARCEALEGQLANLTSQLHAKVPHVTGASSGDLGALQSAEQALHSAIRDAKSALSLQQSRARLELVTTRIEVDAPDLVTLGIAERSATNNRQPKIARLLERLSEIESRALLDELSVQVSRAAHLGEDEQQRTLLELDHVIATEVKQQRVRLRCQADADAEALKIAHVEGELADTIRSRALDVTDRATLTALRSDVKDMLDEAEREANAAFVTQQAMLVMAELGYAVDEPFELIEQHGDGFFARKDGLGKHALQVSVDATVGVLQTRVVAVADSTIEEDVLAEEATCDDALALVHRLVGHGVESEVVFHRAPGELPVAKTPRTAPRKKKRAQLKEMELNG